jgi:hypothetical protein
VVGEGLERRQGNQWLKRPDAESSINRRRVHMNWPSDHPIESRAALRRVSKTKFVGKCSAITAHQFQNQVPKGPTVFRISMRQRTFFLPRRRNDAPSNSVAVFPWFLIRDGGCISSGARCPSRALWSCRTPQTASRYSVAATNLSLNSENAIGVDSIFVRWASPILVTLILWLAWPNLDFSSGRFRPVRERQSPVQR